MLPGGSGGVSKKSDIGVEVVTDEAVGESGGVGNVFAKSVVSIRASASKSIVDTADGLRSALACCLSEVEESGSRMLD